MLNYGHTLAHALETAAGHALLHGEAVAIGLVFAAHLAAHARTDRPAHVVAHHEVARRRARAADARAARAARPTTWSPIMARDKKSGGGLTFVLAGPSGIERVDDPDPAAVRKALAAIGVEG